MNKIVKYALVGFYAMTFYYVQQVNASEIQNKDAKCHVVLYGGAETLYFRTIKTDELANLKYALPEREIRTLFSRDKQKIYKVVECVFIDEKFQDNNSILLDTRTPR